MRKITLAFVVFVLLVSVLSAAVVFGGEEEAIKWCPRTLVTDNDRCMNCHVMSGGEFVLKETRPDAHLTYPSSNVKIIGFGTEVSQGLFQLYGSISMTEYDQLFKALEFLDLHNINYLVIEIYSYGGDLFAAWRMKGLLQEWMDKGNIVETKVYGAAVSAAAIIFAVGQTRTIHAQAELMLHELWTFKFFDVSTPSDKEEEARVLRHLQDTITMWLATRCDKTKEELDKLVKKQEFWLRGKEAYEIGLANKLIGE